MYWKERECEKTKVSPRESGKRWNGRTDGIKIIHRITIVYINRNI